MADLAVAAQRQRGQAFLRFVFLLAVVSLAGVCPLQASSSAESEGRLLLMHRTGAILTAQQRQTFDLPPSKGRFLVATERMGDPRFAQSVILLLDYGPSGALGLIVNRPTEMKLSEVLPDLGAAAVPDRTVYFGGPVDVTRLTILIQSDEDPPDSAPVFRDVYATGSRKALEQLLSGETDFKTFRIYAGYAGWGPQQLEREINAGGWLVTEADVASVFLKDESKVWPDLMRQISVLWVFLTGDLERGSVLRN